MEQKGFRILDHPADLGIEAFGRTIEEAFEQAAAALISIILEPSSIQHQESKTIEITAEDREQLLVKWLTEVLYLYDGEGFVGKDFKISELRPTYLKATIYGGKFDPKRYITKLDVKAVTYHQLNVIESEQGGSVRVFLDI